MTGGVGQDLRLRRYFTTEGVHPFDEIEWDVRDAVIQNFKTGEIAFEQKGVEVPKSWSQNATNIAAQKYFRGSQGTPQRERSVKQMIGRVVDRYHEEGLARGYFADENEAAIFKDELTHLLVTQKAAFNSPVWFNVGWRPNPQVAACFILSVEDEMRSILNWYVEEGLIFKHGSGSGINLSALRSSKERLRSGGTASGPVSFMRGADASAGTIKSGGATRRAAKMVVLNVDHPDVKDFIWCKALEERKARALREAGFDVDLDGKDSHSLQYQNANNSVRVTDEFMQAVVDDKDWELKAVTTGEAIETVKARELFREIAEAAWDCADPGLQYDTTINDWHPIPNSGRINASNPCFPGDVRVHTDRGLVRFDDLMRRVIEGETFEVYTHDITNPDAPKDSVTLSKPTQFMVTGVNEMMKLRFSDGRELRCTPNHRIWTENRGWARADELTEEDRIKVLDHATPATMAGYELPVSANAANYVSKGDSKRQLNLPEKWTEEFAYYLGWLIGDGSVSGNVVSTIYGSKEDQDEVLPRHMKLITEINGGISPRPSTQENGTVQLRMSRRPFRLFLEALGVKAVRAREKQVPWSIFEAPDDIVSAFLRGLFDADGCSVDLEKAKYAGLGSRSKQLLRGVQLLLSKLGISGSVYEITRKRGGGFRYTRKKDGQEVVYKTEGPSYDLRISASSLGLFFGLIGFDLERKLFKLEGTLAKHERYKNKSYSKLLSRESDGFELTYNLTEPRNHSYVIDGVLVANCSEYLSVDNSSCNLSSLNLLKFLNDDGTFDIDAFKHSVEIMFLAQEISVGFAHYPTEKIAENSHKMRQLGQGVANLGALLMAMGLPYDSDEGRAMAASIQAVQTGYCYATSARIAKRVGPFEEYEKNRQPFLRVMNKHRNAAYEIPNKVEQRELLDEARHVWDEVVALGDEHGYRNAQAVVAAPTGTIGLLMDCDTTGIEPDLALKKTKKLVGGGTMSIVNQTVPRALRKLGYSEDQIKEIVAYIDDNGHVLAAPHLRKEHIPVFDTAMGERSIHYMGHIRMLSAIQPLLSGTASKTVNLPEHVTVEDVEHAYIEGWRLGLKALAIYRDNCKVGQPLSVHKKGDDKRAEPIPAEPYRRRMPKKRASKTIKFRVADTEGYLTVGEFADGTVGEIFLKVAKQGSTLAGIMDAFAISLSMGLQYGVPLSAYVKQFVNTRFEPSGMTDDSDFRIATSILDYVFRVLALEYLSPEERQALGIRTAGERQAEIEAKLDPNATGNGNGGNGHTQDQTEGPGVIVLGPVADAQAGSMPFCGQCGVQMQPAGSCFACPSCGTTSGCS
jgi:ribonucleoside-diphosphate reductase alpha chain